MCLYYSDTGARILEKTHSNVRTHTGEYTCKGTECVSVDLSVRMCVFPGGSTDLSCCVSEASHTQRCIAIDEGHANPLKKAQGDTDTALLGVWHPECF